MQRIAAFFDDEAGDVRQGGLLRLAHVLQQCARGRDGQRQVVCAEAAQVECTQLVGEQARGARQLEVPRRPHARRAVDQRAQFARMIFRNQQLGGLEAFQLGVQRRFAIGLEHGEAPRGEIQPREAERHAIFPGPAGDRG